MSDEKTGDIKKDLTALWKATVDQMDEIKDAIVRSSHAGKARLDVAFLRKARQEALGAVGEKVAELAADGVPFPDALKPLLDRVNDLERQIEEQNAEAERLGWPVGGIEDIPPRKTSDAPHAPADASSEAGAGAAAPGAATPGAAAPGAATPGEGEPRDDPA